jgi:hypothetical protein
MEEQNQIDKSKSLAEVGNQPDLILNAKEPISFFSKDKDFVFAHQKIAKLVAAVYMITNFLPNEEPIKWNLRNLCMKALHLNIDLKNNHTTNPIEKERELKELSLEIVSLLEVGMYAGLVSSMNLSILKKEFHGLLEHIEKTLGHSNISGPFLGAPLVTSTNRETVDHVLHRSDEKFNRNFARNKPVQGGPVSKKGVNTIKDKMSVTNNDFYDNDSAQIPDEAESAQKSSKLKEFGPVAVKKNKRQSIIIGILKRKKEIDVKDVSQIIGDCSEKTIQRELLELVSTGILGKTGERRWTRYYLATPQ